MFEPDIFLYPGPIGLALFWFAAWAVLTLELLPLYVLYERPLAMNEPIITVPIVGSFINTAVYAIVERRLQQLRAWRDTGYSLLASSAAFTVASAFAVATRVPILVWIGMLFGFHVAVPFAIICVCYWIVRGLKRKRRLATATTGTTTRPGG